MVQIAVLGFGTVGSGVVELIDRNHDAIEGKFTEGVHVKRILDLRDFPDSPYGDRVTHDFEEILGDPDIKIICETMGGKEPAYTFSKKALSRGISVCTSNKELVAAYGPELIRIARENNCNYMFEASVGGGIPIIRPMNTSLTPESITSIVGILNGTTNYIMTRMEQAGLTFEDALKEAQDNGYAERNPAADIEGHDACRKIAILSSLMVGKTVRYEDIPCEGITNISKADHAYARKLNMAIKLLGVSSRTGDTLAVRTAPYLVPQGHPLYGVEDVFNGVFVRGNMVDDLMFYGRGAGKFPTASAVVSDVIDCAKHLGKHVVCFWDHEVLALADNSGESYRYLVRTGEQDLKAVGENFGSVEYVEAGQEGELAFVTAEMTEAEFNGKYEALESRITRIRILPKA